MIRLILSLVIAVFIAVNFYGCKPAPKEEVGAAAVPVFQREGPLPVLEQNAGFVEKNWIPAEDLKKYEEFVDEPFEVEISEEEQALLGSAGD